MDSTGLKRLSDVIKQAHDVVEDCFEALAAEELYGDDDRAAICDDLDEASACLDSALRLAHVEAP
jgi:hypothetical protein